MSDGNLLQPLFLDGPAGRLFAICHAPANDLPPRTGVLILPPFAEEMNRSRRMLSEQAKDLARHGIATLLLDLYGTGDSEGAFDQASWELWRKDVAVALAWLRRAGIERLAMIGLRLGALLALDVLRDGVETIERVVLWQPLLRGRQMTDQMIRMRLAANLLEPVDRRETAQALRARLIAGEALELGGYTLNPELVRSLDVLNLADLAPPQGIRVDWIEVRTEAEMSPGGRRIVNAWREAGSAVTVATVAGPPFWSLMEITVAPQLIEHTRARLMQTRESNERNPVRFCLS